VGPQESPPAPLREWGGGTHVTGSAPRRPPSLPGMRAPDRAMSLSSRASISTAPPALPAARALHPSPSPAIAELDLLQHTSRGSIRQRS
jgi:hypothetical protein